MFEWHGVVHATLGDLLSGGGWLQFSAFAMSPGRWRLVPELTLHSSLN